MTTETHARTLAFETLEMVIKDHAYSNLALNQTLQHNDLSQADKGLITEIVYGTLKRQYTLDYMLKPFIQTKLKRWVRILLWMSLYQYRYLDRIPTHAVINEAVTIAKKRGGSHQGKIVNGILRQITRSELPDPMEIQDPKRRLSISYSLPMWLIKHWITHHGFEETERIAQSMLENVAQTVRVNTSKISTSEAVQRLEEEGFTVEEDAHLDVCLHVSDGVIANSDSFREGLISIQDKSSMFVATYLDPQIGDHILDACSAPGGKACHIGELLRGTGQVTATDIHQHKIALIQENIDKLGLTHVKAMQHDATTPYHEMYDRILVDAPCSGLGVLRHKPEIKYTQSWEDIHQLVDLQLEILENVKHQLKPGGTLVYSTCTIEQLENENVIYTFLKQNSDFEFEPIEHPITHERVKTLQILPQDFNSDGFFITRIKRKDK
ncbi:16S rRNA (cytosine(967)-C(5))-methyltransferase RsmB [Staphylococcus argensis]|uniref:16S rRNA (cytosine(967)-C(5))-methyltransferase n=1 Tax=Staphylococcus argensis TaxID=1607738 RepID=A0A2K4FEL5_9STAP|nr:16S rRNA (cytosine(967)-C(5))-methyltransferase RsmB [Staphylococcus argensis]MCY6990271.1 16S rRNA (cytosine(967)-C(5))-methyltransferase RsmB [Staphylococcus argensis]POA09789.1 16S rRNA (cytosine(967)-C(5))-methyltransferase RsmB [Staphylococcus argensis]